MKKISYLEHRQSYCFAIFLCKRTVSTLNQFQRCLIKVDYQRIRDGMLLYFRNNLIQEKLPNLFWSSFWYIKLGGGFPQHENPMSFISFSVLPDCTFFDVWEFLFKIVECRSISMFEGIFSNVILVLIRPLNLIYSLSSSCFLYRCGTDVIKCGVIRVIPEVWKEIKP